MRKWLCSYLRQQQKRIIPWDFWVEFQTGPSSQQACLPLFFKTRAQCCVLTFRKGNTQHRQRKNRANRTPPFPSGDWKKLGALDGRSMAPFLDRLLPRTALLPHLHQSPAICLVTCTGPRMTKTRARRHLFPKPGRTRKNASQLKTRPLSSPF